MDSTQIFSMTKEQLIGLDPKDVRFFIPDEGIVHIAKGLDAYWQYDLEKAKAGKPGYHAILKSKNHSDGFFVSRIMLQYPNILEIIAFQLVYRYRYFKCPQPEWVAGIPDGASKLGEKVAEFMGVRLAEMEKVDGKISMVTNIPPFSTLLFVEDFCTKGTGFKEAVTDTKKQNPTIIFLPYELVILNRGRMNSILVDGIGPFSIIPSAYYPVDDWDPNSKEGCPLCNMGSIPIKPKETEENWATITSSQK